ncbi:ABC-2 type transport system permease protein/lipopolysaccharide transport system permease protein [Marinicella litoralis]|uniref:ABC-2 type transport system permease protein/lipopolysaccharide transport system permease protein n=1 Tax=Marinicella litoralis TaxID=644220 RepID=A0A4R6XTD9_9GAMM|nr:ABC transporter permease [Marinicella litoralis]TDR23225.1 ABC-2 type transport system permease protein/lipopolysaccharide transport system permease protein [Marinicella litoralis]
MDFITDIKEGFKRRRLWKRLAVLELKSRYQGAFIGTSWILLTLILKVGMLSLVYSMVLQRDIKEYVLFLAIGVLTWNFISAAIISSGMVFSKGSSLMQQMKLPQSIFVFQNVYRETLILILYQLFAIPLLIALKGFAFISVLWLVALAGFVLIVLNAFFVNMWLGWLAVRYKDVQPFLGSVVLILFLVTPVLWPLPEKFNDSLLFLLNPFYHLLELIRAPVLNNEIPVLSFLVGIGCLLFNVVICIIFYPRVKNKLVLWL